MSIRSFEGRTPILAEGAWVDSDAVVLGSVSLGRDASVWPGCVIRGDVHDIEIGDATNVQDGTVIHVTHDGPFSPGGRATRVGSQVTVGHRAVLHACSIDDRVLVGINAVVLDGAKVGSDTILGAGALVPPGRKLPSGWLYVGAPVRPVRKLSERELEFLEYSSAHYVRLKNRHAAQGVR
jgi:carbonic anhydrase/acetyltransferase-like protein (isoleucine patch superfamily)